MSTEGASVDIHGLSWAYESAKGRVEAIKEITFSVEKGDLCTIIGPSASGKSTLLYIMAGLLPLFTGEVLINGERTRPGRHATSLILQNYGLLPWKTVWQNVVLGLQIRRLPPHEIQTRGERILNEMGIAEAAKRYPSELSGGQQQRVAIARSLATEPDLLLMDEPFSSLDAYSRESMQDVLQEIQRYRGLTVILVTHSIEEAAFLGRKIIVFSGHPGSIYRIFDNPAAGLPEYRKNDDFFHLCTKLRGAMEMSRKEGVDY